MTSYLVLKFLHIIGATILFGTGIGIAFFMLQAHTSGDAAMIAGTAGIVVADFLFMATAAVRVRSPSLHIDPRDLLADEREAHALKCLPLT